MVPFLPNPDPILKKPGPDSDKRRPAKTGLNGLNTWSSISSRMSSTILLLWCSEHSSRVGGLLLVSGELEQDEGLLLSPEMVGDDGSVLSSTGSGVPLGSWLNSDSTQTGTLEGISNDHSSSELRRVNWTT